MIRQQLQQLSKSEVIELILQQQAVIEQLQVRVAELEEQIKRLTQPPKDCSNSSVSPGPARQDYPSTWTLNALPSPVATRTCGDKDVRRQCFRHGGRYRRVDATIYTETQRAWRDAERNAR